MVRTAKAKNGALCAGQKNEYAAMAQQVEHVLGKDEVTGSNPVSSSKKTTQRGGFFLYFRQKRSFEKRPRRTLAVKWLSESGGRKGKNG